MDYEESFLKPQDDDILFQQIDEDLDFAFALSLQAEIDGVQNEVKQVDSPCVSQSSSKPLKLIDPQWDLIDPNPDIHALFLEFNAQFFYGKLDAVEVRWSPRMTLCAGVCCYEGRGRLCSVRLSLPLLKLRPRKDLIETLLHEMIHAYLFVTANNKDRDAHGPEFLSHMHRINKEAGTKISVYHSFHDEVDSYRTHWWKCDGPCQKRRPFYGIVKRAMNRAPGPRDNWWAQHQSTCGGAFHKIKEPDNYKQKSLKRKMTDHKDQTPSFGIKNLFQPSTSKSPSFVDAKKHKETDIHTIKSIFAEEDNLISLMGGSPTAPVIPLLREKNTPAPFTGHGFELGSASSDTPMSFLAKLRKDLGRPNPSAASLTTELNSNKNDVKKNSSSDTKEPTCSVNASLNSSQNIVQSSMDKFVLPSLKDDASKPSCGVNSSLNSSTTLNSSQKMVQSSMEKFVQPPSKDDASQHHVKCPVCSILLPSTDIDSHLVQCLLKNV